MELQAPTYHSKIVRIEKGAWIARKPPKKWEQISSDLYGVLKVRFMFEGDLDNYWIHGVDLYGEEYPVQVYPPSKIIESSRLEEKIDEVT